MIRLVAQGNEEIGGGGVASFQWSTSEQEYPLEENTSGDTLYAKQINFGSLPNNGTKTVAHSLGVNVNNIFRAEGYAVNGTDHIPISFAQGAGNNISLAFNNTNVSIFTNLNYAGFTGYVKVIYNK